jgi:tetratricopeptide (TPR) repeat protein
LLTTDISRNRYQVQKAHYLLGRILIQKGAQNLGLAELNLSRELSERTLAQDKSKLAALMDTDSQNVQPPATEARASSSVAVVAADPLALRKVEARKEQVRFALADSYNNLGAIAATNDDYSAAITYFKGAAGWNPSLDGLDYNWARAAFAGSQFADVIGPLSRYLKLHPDDTGARSVMGISQFMIGNYPGCMETLQPVIGEPNLVSQAEYVYAESMIRTGQTGLGMERLRALERSNPEIPDVHRSLGEALGSQGEQQKALDEFRIAIQVSPRDADAHYDLGKMELEGGDTAAALPQLETAVRLSPDKEKFHRELADAYSAALRPADAQKEMETCNLLRAHAQNSTLSHQVTASEQ